MSTHDLQNRPYARLSNLHPGSTVIVDDGFEGCFVPWSKREVFKIDGELALLHNAPECGACGGSSEKEDCFHSLEGQLDDDGDTLIGIYHEENFVPNQN